MRMQDKWGKFEEEVDDVVPLAVREVGLEPGGWAWFPRVREFDMGASRAGKSPDFHSYLLKSGKSPGFKSQLT